MKDTPARKFVSLIEVSGAILLTFAGIRAVRFTPLSTWQTEYLVLPFSEYALMMAVPLAFLYGTRRNYGNYGITFHNVRYHADVALTCLIVVLPFSALKYGYLAPVLRISYLQPEGALMWAVLIIISVILILIFLKNKPSYSTLPALHLRRFIFIIGTVFIVAVVTAPFTNRIPAFVFYFFFVGFGEEILFRGYIQSRLNASFGRPFRLMGVHWGWGLIIASVLFGIMHFINPYNPYQIWWAFWTFFSGLLFGLIREKTGSILAPAIVHGTPRALAALFFGM
jgi:uncharacterized protein